MTSQTVLLCAGGTGGHLFPAQSLAEELIKRGWLVHLATDERVEKFVSDFPAEKTHVIRSATFTGRGPLSKIKTLSELARGYMTARGIIRRIKPTVVVGFGGYPTVPPLMAAAHKDVPTILHEQNAIMGRANKFLASRVSVIASGFELVGGADTGRSAPVMVTGNPLRDVAHEAAKKPYAAPKDGGVFRLLVFGGSQGARFFSEVTPDAIEALPPDLAYRLRITIQARPEDSAALRGRFVGMDVTADVAEFFDDLPNRIADAHLVVCRSGASSVSELALIGRPSILVPYPGALDDDQGANAKLLAETGGATLVRQNELSAEKLAGFLREAMENPAALAKRAKSAKRAGVPDAARRLADLVESHA